MTVSSYLNNFMVLLETMDYEDYESYYEAVYSIYSMYEYNRAHMPDEVNSLIEKYFENLDSILECIIDHYLFDLSIEIEKLESRITASFDTSYSKSLTNSELEYNRKVNDQINNLLSIINIRNTPAEKVLIILCNDIDPLLTKNIIRAVPSTLNEDFRRRFKSLYRRNKIVDTANNAYEKICSFFSNIKSGL